MPTTDRHDADSTYDAVVVGARPAGAATALLLARQGRRVLVLDRAAFGSDTTSTHALMKGGVLQLQRWGLLDRIRDAGTPALRHTVVHYSDMDIDIPVGGDDDVDALYAPRRTVLDPMLAVAAAEAGADVRFETSVSDLLRDRDGRVAGLAYRSADGRRFEARAPITIGADGARSFVARSVGAPTTRAGTHASAVVHAYFADVDVDGFQWFFRSGAGAGVIPTNGGVLAYIAIASPRFATELRPDVEAGFWRLLRQHAPEAADLVATAERTSRFHVHAGMGGFQRQPGGRGWALVGDASHFKDPISAHGLTDALRDAELLARALVPTLDDRDELAAALASYEAERDRLSSTMFDLADQVAGYEWSADDARTLLKGMSRCMGEEVDVLRGLEPLSTAQAA
jgi:2-polyprenyl-6-methoxyphenol hydroxylase-like FAD-dependent oxidoreductase